MAPERTQCEALVDPARPGGYLVRMAFRRSFWRSEFTGILAILALLLTGIGCGGTSNGGGDGSDDGGGDDDGGGNGAGTGAIREPWLDYCTATFTEDYEVLDVFGDVTFTAHEGESYLMSE